MDRSGCIFALGTALTDVVGEVSRRHGSAPTKALTSLCVATNCFDVSSSDEWFAAMQDRVSKHRQVVLASDSGRDAVGQVRAIVQSILRNGCRAEDIVEQATTVASMLTVEGLSSSLVDTHANAFARQVASHGAPRVSSHEFERFFCEGPVADVFLAFGWWFQDRPLALKRRKIALRAIPPTILIQYELPRKAGGQSIVRHRTLHLDTQFRETGSVVPLARTLYRQCACFGLSESDLQRYLTKLQALARAAQAEAEDDLDPAVRAYAAGAPSISQLLPTMASGETPSSLSASGASGKGGKGPQKADLGLLYRDPAKALENVDLQDADDVVVQEFKNKMDENFKPLRPGDPGYQYDKRVTVKATAKSEWDDSEDDN
jgi:hypothetical protein